MKTNALELLETTPAPEIQPTETPHLEKMNLNLSLKTILRFWLIGAVVVMLGYWFYQTLELIYLIFSALIIAFSIEGIILSLQKRLKSRSLSIALSYFFLFVFVFFWGDFCNSFFDFSDILFDFMDEFCNCKYPKVYFE